MEVHSGKISWPENDDFFSLFEAKKFYAIPAFQRPYAWSLYQREELLIDVRRARATGENFALPTVLIKLIRRKNSIEYYEIGDGQQRLTSIVLLLLAIWHKSRIKGGNLNVCIVPAVTDPIGTEGILGKKLDEEGEIWISPRIAFQADEPNRELKSLFQELAVEDLEKLRAEGKKAKRTKSLIDAFFEFYDLLLNDEVEDLKELLSSIREKISLPITEFTSTENMYRSFGRMNSLGVPLQNSELIKAAFYGAAEANQSPSLGNEIVEYWTNNFEDSFWSEKKRNSVLLDEALLHCIAEAQRFPQASYKNWVNERQSVQHWLFDQWVELLDKVRSATELRELFESLKRNLDRFKTILKTDTLGLTLAPGTLLWEAKYTYDLIGPGKAQSFAVILRVLENFKDNEASTIQALKLLQRFGVTFWLTVEKKDIIGALLKKDSVFTQSNFTLDELKTYLLAEWPSKDEIQKSIIGRNYFDGPVLTKAFLYADNEKAREMRLEASALRPHTEDYDRDHILPNSEAEWGKLDETELALRRDLINKIGNAISFHKTLNRSVKDMSVDGKIDQFYQTQSPGQVNWLPEIIKLYSPDKVWGPQQMRSRTTTLATYFSILLDPTKL